MLHRSTLDVDSSHIISCDFTHLVVAVTSILLVVFVPLFKVAEQLFRPLVFQCIHWFTGNTLYESPDTVVLLEAILVSCFHGNM